MPTSSEVLKYQQRFIAFIDVLGFGSIVSKSGRTSASENRIIKRITNALLWSLDELSDLMGPYSNVIFTHFSDSFVISAPANRDIFDIYKFSIMISKVIHCFLASHLLLRGGITKGQLIHNDRILFGPAMNVAYKLESQIAKYPRIIIDPYIQEYEYIIKSHRLEQDDDGLLYINYFKPEKAFFLVPGWLYCIQKAIEEIPRTLELEEKRKWLIEKYNKALSSFSYKDFESRLKETAWDDSAVDANYQSLLNDAKRLHQLNLSKMQRSKK